MELVQLDFYPLDMQPMYCLRFSESMVLELELIKAILTALENFLNQAMIAPDNRNTGSSLAAQG
jgi:hypothetical protein